MSVNNSTSKSPESYRLTSNNDELDLLEIVGQLWRGKAIIIATMIFALFISVIYLVVAKEKWTSTASVTLPAAGQVANYNAALSVLYLQSPEDKPAIGVIQQQLFSRFSASINALSESLKNQEIPLELKVDQLNKGSNDALSISFSAETGKTAQQELSKYIQQINDTVVDDYGADITRSMSVKTRELTDSIATQNQVAMNKKQRRQNVMKQALKIAEASNITHSQLNQAEYLSDDTLYLLGTDALNAMIINEASKPLTFDETYYSTQRALLAITHFKIQVDNLQSYRYIAHADLPIRRDSPKKSLTVLLALIVGGVLGSAIVIGRNVTREYRLRQQD